jgi:hypothetical protein
VSQPSFDEFTNTVVDLLFHPEYVKVFRVMPASWPREKYVKLKATVYLDLEQRFKMSAIQKSHAFFFTWIDDCWIRHTRYRSDPGLLRWQVNGWELVPRPVIQKLIEAELASHVEAHFLTELSPMTKAKWWNRDFRLRQLEERSVNLPKSSPSWTKRIP